MNPAVLQVLITTSPQIAALVIGFLKSIKADNEANQITLVLQRSDANADQLIANAQAALGIPPTTTST